jgi:hypothetical protein
LAGRRAGKSFVTALIATYLAAFKDYSAVLAPGEKATILITASDRRQARVLLRYVRALITENEMLRQLVVNETKDGLELSNRVVIEVGTASFRSTRGYTLAAFLGDESCFWNVDADSANADVEVFQAIRPALSTTNGLVVSISSPYARRGVAWSTYSKHFSKDGDPVLVWNSDTRSMNPSISEDVIESAFEADPAAAWSEYGTDGEVRFRSDVETFIAPEAIEAAVVPGRVALPVVPGVKYFSFVDPAGGSGRDSMSAAVAHQEADGRVVLDLVIERRPPFSPEAAAEEFSESLSPFVSSVTGDRWGGEWPREQLAKHGLKYELSEKTKSELYGALLPLLNSSRVELLDLPRLRSQLAGLERRTARGGRESIDSRPNSNDDVINAAAGALVLASAAAKRRVHMPAPLTVGRRPALGVFGSRSASIRLGSMNIDEAEAA